MTLTHHEIYKFLRNKSVDYTCDTCRTSYLSRKSLAEDHPNLNNSTTVIIVQDKRREQEEFTK